MNMGKSSEKKSFRILLAEDDIEMRKLLKWHLAENGFTVFECIDGVSFSKKLSLLKDLGSSRLYDLIIADNRMPGENGLKVLEEVVYTPNCPPIILITAFPDRETIDRAEQLEIIIFSKPFDIDDLLLKIREIEAFNGLELK